MARLPELSRSPTSTGCADHHRRPDRLPAPARAAGASGSPRPGCPPSTATFRAVGYRAVDDDASTSRWCYGDLGDGEDVLVRVHSRVPDRRRVRLAALRLRPAAARRAGPGRRRGPRASCSTCAATRAGASGCCTSCRPTSCRTRGRTPSTPTCDLGLPADARDYGTGAQILVDLGVALDAAADQQPGQAGRAGGVRAAGDRPGAAARRARTRRTCATCGPSGTGWVTCSRLGRVDDAGAGGEGRR